MGPQPRRGPERELPAVPRGGEHPELRGALDQHRYPPRASRSSRWSSSPCPTSPSSAASLRQGRRVHRGRTSVRSAIRSRSTGPLPGPGPGGPRLRIAAGSWWPPPWPPAWNPGWLRHRQCLLRRLREPRPDPHEPRSGGATGGIISDPRYLGRMVKFPSGEMPRSGRTLAIGAGGGLADFGGSATVDEIVFGSPVANAGWVGPARRARCGRRPVALGAGRRRPVPADPGERGPYGQRTRGAARVAPWRLPAAATRRRGRGDHRLHRCRGRQRVHHRGAGGRGLLGTRPQPTR